MEEWKDILGYEGLYQASNYGRIKSLERFVESVSHGKPCMRHIRECILQLQSHPNDYLQVNLNVDGKSKTFRVHTLIWEAFNGEIPEGMEIDHINAVRTDNRLENLRIMTHQENLNNPLTVIKRSNARKGMFKGELNPMYGRHHSEDTKKKMNLAKQNMSDETRRRYSEAAKERWRKKREFLDSLS